MKTRPDDKRGAPNTGIGSRKGTDLQHHRGNIAFVPTDQMRSDVRTWAKVVNADTIAAKLRISRSTLDKYFKEELADGVFEAVATVGGRLLEKALKGDVQCMIFYLRTRGKWSTKMELSGPDDSPIPIDISHLTVDEQKLLLPVLEKLLPAMIDQPADEFDPATTH